MQKRTVLADEDAVVDRDIDAREGLAGWRTCMHHLVAAVGAELVPCLLVGQQLREDLLL